MAPSTDRQTFRQLVAEIAAKAQAKLPECNGRVDKAVALVLNGDVELLPDGTAAVYSQSNGVSSYAVVNGHCDCSDSPRAPHGYCKHRLAVGIQRRVQELLPQSPAVETAASAAPVMLAAPAVPPALPEAPAPGRAGMRLEAQVVMDGRPVKVTVWGPDDADVQARLAAVLAQHPAPATPPAPTQGPGDPPQCPPHGVLRKGKRGWFCPHKLEDDSWCPFKAK